MSTNSAAAASSNSSRVKSLAITAICLVLVYVFTSVVNIRLPFAPTAAWSTWATSPLRRGHSLRQAHRHDRRRHRHGSVRPALRLDPVGSFHLSHRRLHGFVVGAITEKRKNMGFIVLALIAACAIKIGRLLLRRGRDLWQLGGAVHLHPRQPHPDRRGRRHHPHHH